MARFVIPRTSVIRHRLVDGSERGRGQAPFRRSRSPTSVRPPDEMVPDPSAPLTPSPPRQRRQDLPVEPLPNPCAHIVPTVRAHRERHRPTGVTTPTFPFPHSTRLNQSQSVGWVKRSGTHRPCGGFRSAARTLRHFLRCHAHIAQQGEHAARPGHQKRHACPASRCMPPAQTLPHQNRLDHVNAPQPPAVRQSITYVTT